MTKTQALYLLAVLRFQTLRHDVPSTAEGRSRLARLGRALGLKPSRARAEGEDRRVFWRTAARWPVTVLARGRQAAAELIDIGAGGMRVEGADWLFPSGVADVEATVRLKLPNTDMTLDVPVELRHVDPMTQALGLRFCGPPALP